MKLHLHEGGELLLHTSAPTVGYAVRAIELRLDDFLRLRALSPEQLLQWVELWLLKFRP